MARTWRVLIAVLIVLLLSACAPSDPAPLTPLPEPSPNASGDAKMDAPPAVVDVIEYTYEIVNKFPHDPGAFTQGLIYTDGIFFEGTGLYGQSTLRKVEPETGEVLMGARLPEEVFGEGITLYDGKIFQLTWRENTGYIINAETFELIDTFTYATEGWGLTHDGERLIMSDGSETLTFLDPRTLASIGSVDVTDDGMPVTQLNELEYIDGQVYANIWQTDTIVIIDPATGLVNGRIDLTGLLAPADRTESTDVLNGIAYDEDTKRLFVTGKLWPYLFELKLIPTE